jgi:hypothetical protein
MNFMEQVSTRAFTTTFEFVPNGWNIALVFNNNLNNADFNGIAYVAGAGVEGGFYQNPPAPKIGNPSAVYAIQFDQWSALAAGDSNWDWTYSAVQQYVSGQYPSNPNLSSSLYFGTNKISTSPVPLNAPSTFTGSISGTTMTVTSVSSGAIAVGATVYGNTVGDSTMITAQTSGTAGGAGTYTVAVSQAVPSETLTTGPNTTTGDVYSTTISYDGSNLNLCLYDVTAANGSCSSATSGTGTYFLHTWTNVNIPAEVGGTAAWMGLTSSTNSNIPYNLLVNSFTYSADTPANSPPFTAYNANSRTHNGTTNATASPVYSVAPGTYSGSQTVAIASSTVGSNICYVFVPTTTTLTTLPVPNNQGGCSWGTPYSAPISITQSGTLYAVAGTNYTAPPSTTVAGVYTIGTLSQAATPTFSVAAGTYATAQTVTISDATSGATVYYTTNGTTPTTSSSVYSGPITVSSSETIEAIAVASGYSNSSVASATYTINSTVPAPTFSPAGGTYTTKQTVTISDTTAGTTIYYTTNGTTPTSSSTVYTGPITVSATETLEAIAIATGDANTVGTATYTISPVLPTPAFSVAAGTYTTSQSLTISEATAGATIYYTTNGATPTTSSSVYSGPITVSASETVEAIAVEVGYTNSAAASAKYTINPVLPTPAFSVAAGTYTTSQSLTISEATAGATIYYTTNGATPTTSSSVYSGPITVSATETVEAIAVETGYTNSAAASAKYTISTVLPTPAFSVAAGTYTTSQSLTISEATAGATIYYTTNGTTPTTSSSAYSGPITVSATETVEAIAVEAGYNNSAIATATYTITPISTGGSGTTYINYPSGGFSASAFDLNGGATITSGGLVQVTDGGTYEGRSAWYSTKVPVQSFTTDFTFQQLNALADGMTFTIQGEGTNALGSDGGNLGYGGINNSVAVKFDLYNNGGEGTDSTGLYTDGAQPTTPAVDLTSTGIVLTSGDLMHAHLVYDGTNLTMTLTDTVTGKLATEVFPVDIPSIVGGDTAYVGFTGGTGWESTTQNVTTWTYTVPPATIAATPTFSVAPGTYTTSQSVSISDTTVGSTIYYTTNGTTPTTSSSVYSGAITVNATETLEAIAVETGYSNSAVASASYTISTVLPTPTFGVAAGTYASSQSVTIADATAGTTIYYTTNGTTPTTSSSVYSGPISVNASETLESIAVETGYTNSAVASATYTISPAVPAPTFKPAAGAYTTSQSLTILDATANATIYYTVNGTTPTTSSTKYTGPFLVDKTSTIKAVAIGTGNSSSSTTAGIYTIEPVLAAPTFSVAAGTYTTSQSVAITDTTAGTTIYYTTNGTAPTTASSVYSGAITVSATETLEAIAVETGYTTSAAASAAYTINATSSVLAAPTFTPAAGTYTTAQTVTIKDSTANVTIYYTTDGTTPTTSSTKYTGPIVISASQTLTAIAVAQGKSTFPKATAAYAIATELPVPTFSIGTGTYTTAQSVAISDATANATIYYTTNGTTPTTSSTKYTGAIKVSATEKLEAIAVATGHSESHVATASYTIAPVLPTPTYSVASGTYSKALSSVAITDSTPGVTIYYTTNGTAPTKSSTVYTKPVLVGLTTTFHAIAMAAGYSDSSVGTAIYTIVFPAQTPTFSLATGTYTGAQTVTISDATAGASIYYTTNGTAPTTASAKYTGPIKVSATEKLEALAVASGLADSSVASAAYTISGTTAATVASANVGSANGAFEDSE